jgi:hypothetical protein
MSTISCLLPITHPLLSYLLLLFLGCKKLGKQGMSANNGKSEPSYRTGCQPYSVTKVQRSGLGMDLSPSPYSIRSQLNEQSNEPASMSTLALRAPAMLPFPTEMLWEDPRALEIPSRPRSQPDRVELPSIRTVIYTLALGCSKIAF